VTKYTIGVALSVLASLLASTAFADTGARKHGYSRLKGLGPDDNPLNDCRLNPNVGVISIILPARDNGIKGIRSVWHRRGPINRDPTVEDPRRDRNAHVNKPGDRGDPFDVYLSDTDFRPTAKAVVRVLLPENADYQFYENGDVHGITRADTRDNEICGVVARINRQGFFVAQFAIDLPKVALERKLHSLPDFSVFNIVVEDRGLGHNHVRHLDPKVHNEGYPFVRRKKVIDTSPPHPGRSTPNQH